jgi:hypothetical protein
MAKQDKLLGAMRRNPTGDWRIEQLKAIADRHEISYRQPGTSHVTFRSPRGDKLTVPARRHDQAGLHPPVPGSA